MRLNPVAHAGAAAPVGAARGPSGSRASDGRRVLRRAAPPPRHRVAGPGGRRAGARRRLRPGAPRGGRARVAVGRRLRPSGEGVVRDEAAPVARKPPAVRDGRHRLARRRGLRGARRVLDRPRRAARGSRSTRGCSSTCSPERAPPSRRRSASPSSGRTRRASRVSGGSWSDDAARAVSGGRRRLRADGGAHDGVAPRGARGAPAIQPARASPRAAKSDPRGGASPDADGASPGAAGIGRLHRGSRRALGPGAGAPGGRRAGARRSDRAPRPGASARRAQEGGERGARSGFGGSRLHGRRRGGGRRPAGGGRREGPGRLSPPELLVLARRAQTRRRWREAIARHQDLARALRPRGSRGGLDPAADPRARARGPGRGDRAAVLRVRRSRPGWRWPTASGPSRRDGCRRREPDCAPRSSSRPATPRRGCRSARSRRGPAGRRRRSGRIAALSRPSPSGSRR